MNRLRANSQPVVVALQRHVLSQPPVPQFDERTKLLRPIARHAAAVRLPGLPSVRSGQEVERLASAVRSARRLPPPGSRGNVKALRQDRGRIALAKTPKSRKREKRTSGLDDRVVALLERIAGDGQADAVLSDSAMSQRSASPTTSRAARPSSISISEGAPAISAWKGRRRLSGAGRLARASVGSHLRRAIPPIFPPAPRQASRGVRHAVSVASCAPPKPPHRGDGNARSVPSCGSIAVRPSTA